jgi:hypothetical protein
MNVQNVAQLPNSEAEEVDEDSSLAELLGIPAGENCE